MVEATNDRHIGVDAGKVDLDVGRKPLANSAASIRSG